jgi:hypothetical protein
MKLSNQAVGALLMTLQKCLAEQTDITDLLKDWELEISDGEIVVTNPPTVAPTGQPEKQMFETE